MVSQGFKGSLLEHLPIGRPDGKMVIGCVVIACLLLGIIVFTVGAEGAEGILEIDATQQAQEGEDLEPGEVPAEEAITICVHVAGCVQAPGLYYLEEGARIGDAVEAAGGFTEEANLDAVNLARKISDGEQILIEPIATPFSDVEGTAESSSSGITPEGKVNLNRATAEELQTLSGIGASKAAKIIAHRQAHGPFSSIEELTEVSGIGEKTLESLRDAICI